MATRRIGEMDCRDEGTTSVSNTSMEKVVMAALREGRRVSVDGSPDGSRPLGDVIFSLLLFTSLFFV